MTEIGWNTSGSAREILVELWIPIYRKFLVKYIKYKYLLFIYHLAKINQGTQNKKVIEKSARIHLEIVYFSVRWMLSGAVKVYLVGYT